MNNYKIWRVEYTDDNPGNPNPKIKKWIGLARGMNESIRKAIKNAGKECPLWIRVLKVNISGHKVIDPKFYT